MSGVLTQSAESVDSVINLKEICGMGLNFSFDGFRLVHLILIVFMWAAALLFSKEYMKNEKNKLRYYLFTIFTLLATAGVFLSADLFSIFVFFEIMSFTSFVWVIQDEKAASKKAANTYLAVAVLGGMVMLMGIFIIYSGAYMTSFAMSGSKMVYYVAAICLLFGFGAKAGIFSLHIWMGDTYSLSPAPASALLSGALSKTGVYGMIVISSFLMFGDKNWATFMMWIALLTMVGGAVLAIFSVNVKRILAFSSMSQIGFILMGVAMYTLLGNEGAIAARGTVLHMINHSLIKLVLFMAAGVIFMNIHKLDLNQVKGFGRKKPFLNVVFLIAALGIGGIPLFNGYVSKTLIHESILEAMHLGLMNGGMLRFVEAVFLISGGCTVAYMTKLYIAIFVEKNADENVQAEYDEMSKNYLSIPSKIAISAAAVIIPVLGFLPNLVTDKIADYGVSIMPAEALTEIVSYFSLTNLKGGLISIAIGVILYVCIVRVCLMGKDEEGNKVYENFWPKWWDTLKYFYKPFFLSFLPALFGFLCRILDSLADAVTVALRKTVYSDKPLSHEIELGNKFTESIGTLFNYITAKLNKYFFKEKPIEKNFVHIFGVKYEEIRENNYLISRSMSFGLLMFCIGLVMTLIYLLWLNR